MKLRILIVAILLRISILGFSNVISPPERLLTIGYFGEKVAHPGVNLGYISTVNWDTTNARWQSYWGVGVQLYWHPQNHIGLRIVPQFDLKYSIAPSWNVGLNLDAGFLHKFFSGEVYSVNSQGGISQKSFVGYSRFTYSGNLTFQKTFKPCDNSISIGMNVGGFVVVNELDKKDQFQPVISFYLSKRILP
jgi:hypothetical protein